MYEYLWVFQIRRLYLLLTVRESAIEVPTNLEARRRIAFFTNSLFMNMPRAPRVRKMLSFRSDAYLLYRTHGHEDTCQCLQELHPFLLDIKLIILNVDIRLELIEAITFRVIQYFPSIVMKSTIFLCTSNVLYKRATWCYEAPSMVGSKGGWDPFCVHYRQS